MRHSLLMNHDLRITTSISMNFFQTSMERVSFNDKFCSSLSITLFSSLVHLSSYFFLFSYFAQFPFIFFLFLSSFLCSPSLSQSLTQIESHTIQNYESNKRLISLIVIVCCSSFFLPSCSPSFPILLSLQTKNCE